VSTSLDHRRQDDLEHHIYISPNLELTMVAGLFHLLERTNKQNKVGADQVLEVEVHPSPLGSISQFIKCSCFPD
jgi:hypothetical protein